MEVYVLDSLYRRTAVFDKFESLIWTERFFEVGDFELDLKSTLENRSWFTVGTKLAINNSHRVMTIETVEDTIDPDDKEILKITGVSLENVLSNRVVRNVMTDTTTEPNWVITDTPGNVMRTMFDHVVRNAALDPADAIPFLQPGTFLPASTLPEPTTPIRWEQAPAALLDALKGVSDLYELGFRLVRNYDTSQLYFDVYAGNDRTTRQTANAPVIFAADFGDLQNTTEFTTTSGSKNVAYVFSDSVDHPYQVVYGDKVPPDIDGFDRRVLYVTTQIDAADPDPVGTMIQAGSEALRATRAQQLFDGEINQYSSYTYGVDYDLGDLVEMRNKDGIISYKRITEQIFVTDAQGERSYPTLVADIYTGENDWLSWDSKQTAWIDYDADTTTTWGSLS